MMVMILIQESGRMDREVVSRLDYRYSASEHVPSVNNKSNLNRAHGIISSMICVYKIYHMRLRFVGYSAEINRYLSLPYLRLLNHTRGNEYMSTNYVVFSPQSTSPHL